MAYLSKEELLRAIGEEPIVENENDKVQIAMVLQYRKFIDIINNLPTYYISFNEDKTINVEINKKHNYNPFKDIHSSKGTNVSNSNSQEMPRSI